MISINFSGWSGTPSPFLNHTRRHIRDVIAGPRLLTTAYYSHQSSTKINVSALIDSPAYVVSGDSLHWRRVWSCHLTGTYSQLLISFNSSSYVIISSLFSITLPLSLLAQLTAAFAPTPTVNNRCNAKAPVAWDSTLRYSQIAIKCNLDGSDQRYVMISRCCGSVSVNKAVHIPRHVSSK